jgi:hypothetical protein
VGGDRQTGRGNQGGVGGSGLASSITGSSITYAVGGAGARSGNDTQPIGGEGGGGSTPTDQNGTPGAANTGGGGGGGGSTASNAFGAGGNGGSGVVILRYKFQ